MYSSLLMNNHLSAGPRPENLVLVSMEPFYK